MPLSWQEEGRLYHLIHSEDSPEACDRAPRYAFVHPSLSLPPPSSPASMFPKHIENI